MNFILLSNSCSKNIQVCLPQLAVVLSIGAALSGLILAWAGYQLGARQAPVATLSPTVESVHRELAEERESIARLRQETRAHLDALALRIARLQAHSMRVDALGERLVDVGKLDSDEFDFTAEPAVGGAESQGGQHPQDSADLAADIERLSELLADRERKLLLLEDLLIGQAILEEATPSGKPVKKGFISSAYGYRTDPFTGKKSLHHGVDFAGKRGSEVIAVAAGVVTRSERVPGYGNLVEIRHYNGYTTRYAHNQKNLVKVGDVIAKGDTIALLGSSGRSSGPHVHFEVRKDGKSVNPRRLISART
jgi:murein DD-endopeptidase MepM/ murein hydrolase activator NlpD